MSLELAYTLLGDRDKPMLVMSSALGASRAMWAAQEPLSAHFCLLLYDYRGLGASPAPPGPYSVEDLGNDVVALIDGLGVASVAFCGVSLGGMVGLWVAAHHPFTSVHDEDLDLLTADPARSPSWCIICRARR